MCLEVWPPGAYMMAQGVFPLSMMAKPGEMDSEARGDRMTCGEQHTGCSRGVSRLLLLFFATLSFLVSAWY